MVKKLDIVHDLEQSGGTIGSKRWHTELHILGHVKLHKVKLINVYIVGAEGSHGSIEYCKFLTK